MNDITTCTLSGTDYTCTTPENFYTMGEMFICLLLLILILLKMVELVRDGIFTIPITRKFTGVNSQEGKEEYKL